MRFPISLLALAALCPLSIVQVSSAQAQSAKPGVKSAPRVPKTSKSKRTKVENQVDYLWLKSDEAFHDGDYPRCIRLHRQIVKLDPTVIDSYGNAAWLMWSLGNGGEAVAFLDKGLAANPKNPDMWDAAAQQYALQKMRARSAAAFGKAVALSAAPVDQMLRRRYAHALEAAGSLTKSAAAWRALVADFPAEAVNKNNLARVEAKIAGAAPTAPTTVAA